MVIIDSIKYKVKIRLSWRQRSATTSTYKETHLFKTLNALILNARAVSRGNAPSSSCRKCHKLGRYELMNFPLLHLEHCQVDHLICLQQLTLHTHTARTMCSAARTAREVRGDAVCALDHLGVKSHPLYFHIIIIL